MVRSRDLAQTVQEMGAEQDHQKNLKDQMKSRISELEARTTRLANVVAMGEELREVEVESQLVLDGAIGGHVEEIRKDTGEIILTRPPRDDERQMLLELGKAGAQLNNKEA